MAIAYDRVQLLSAIDRNYSLLMQELMSIPAEKRFEASLEGAARARS